MVAEMRSRLLPGGPPVDHPALYAYVAGVLDDGDRRLVAERIATWREWFEEYLPIRAAAEPEGTEVEVSPSGSQATSGTPDNAPLQRSDGLPNGGLPSTRTDEWIPSELSTVRLNRSEPTPLSVAFNVLAALAPAVGVILAVATRSDGSEGPGSGEAAVQERLASGGTVAVSSGLGWLGCSIRGGAVRLKLRRSATEPYPPFRIVFCRGGAVALEVSAEVDSVTLAPEHLPLVAVADEIRFLPA